MTYLGKESLQMKLKIRDFDVREQKVFSQKRARERHIQGTLCEDRGSNWKKNAARGQGTVKLQEVRNAVSSRASGEGMAQLQH